MNELTTPDFSRLEFMRLVSGHVNIPSSELECLMRTPVFSPYGDAQCKEGD